MSNGKGDTPRNCFSKKFKDNYELINWNKSKKSNVVCDKLSDNSHSCEKESSCRPQSAATPAAP